MVRKPSRNGPWQPRSSSGGSGTSCSEHFIARGAHACCTADLSNVSPALISARYPPQPGHPVLYPSLSQLSREILLAAWDLRC